jgi:hypothetical protein
MRIGVVRRRTNNGFRALQWHAARTLLELFSSLVNATSALSDCRDKFRRETIPLVGSRVVFNRRMVHRCGMHLPVGKIGIAEQNRLSAATELARPNAEETRSPP